MSQLDGEGKNEPVVQSDEARRSFADLLARAGHKGERIVITMYNREHAALIGMQDLERLRALDSEVAERNAKTRPSAPPPEEEG